MNAKKIVLASIIAVLMCGCNQRVIDTQYYYEYAIVKLPNGEIVEGNVDSWADSDSDSICVRINGIDYYGSTNTITLMSKKP